MRIVLVFFLFLPFAGWAQKTDKKLEAQIENAINGFNGNIGVYVKNLRTGKTVMINADTVFPTASIVKVSILLGVMDKMEKGELVYDQPLIYKDSLLYAGVDILGSFKNEEKILLANVIMLMMTMSDNTASLWLQSLAGTGTRINELLDSLGFKNTRVNSRTPGRRPDWVRYGWGQTSPGEMGKLFEMIYRKQILSPAACERMMRCMSRNFWDRTGALSQIPPTVQVFSKGGSIDSVRCEALLVNASRNPYIFCVFTSNNKDTSWTQSNEAWTLTRKLSELIWKKYGD